MCLKFTLRTGSGEHPEHIPLPDLYVFLTRLVHPDLQASVLDVDDLVVDDPGWYQFLIDDFSEKQGHQRGH